MSFSLYDKKEEETLGPFRVEEHVKAIVGDDGMGRMIPKPVILKDNTIVEINDIGPRYLVRSDQSE